MVTIYLFDPDTVNDVAQRHLGKPFDQMIADIGVDLKAIYPEDVSTDMPLVFNSAGGIMYQLKIFAMTPRENVMICGSSIGSSGHSGRQSRRLLGYGSFRRSALYERRLGGACVLSGGRPHFCGSLASGHHSLS